MDHHLLHYVFFIVNLLFPITGLLLIGFVIWIRKIPFVHRAFVHGKHDHALFYFGILLAAALILTGIIGLVGTIFRKMKFLKTYLVLMIIYIMAELIIFIYGVSKGAETIINSLEVVWTHISNDTIAIFQNTFNCCGYLNSSEWNENYPLSCFDNSVQNNTQPWQTPCSTGVLVWIRDNMLVLGAILLGVALFQIGQTVVTVCLIRSTSTSEKNHLGGDEKKSNQNDFASDAPEQKSGSQRGNQDFDSLSQGGGAELHA